MKIFITGATGFIGKHVAKKLSHDGHKLLLLSREPNIKKAGFNRLPEKIKLVKGDLSHIGVWRNKVKKFKPDTLVHLAWEGLRLPDVGVAISSKNLVSGINLFFTLADMGCRHILAVGTQWEYGDRKGIAKENDSLQPFNALAAAKISLQYFGQEIAKEKNIKFSWLRLFSVYGPGQRSGALIPSAVRQLAAGIAPQFKSLDTKNDFIYVEDAASAIAAVIKKQKNQIGVYNVGSGKLTSVREIVREIYKGFSRKMAQDLKSHGQSHVPGLLADISKIKREVGWRPKVDIREGVARTVDYFRKVL